ncbi:Major Facilitator Superfamily (MFS) [Thraustotheca clavata]|uniref:Lysosomal dipeptide transporter MFSD1 n=1 Tax=Thraustotheca clavata TaxID=74557 RepID=A0A1V9YHC8_9STRA|nr:Major Facilitator Superfamily (MFS) [Thraustotheca clavata]
MPKINFRKCYFITTNLFVIEVMMSEQTPLRKQYLLIKTSKWQPWKATSPSHRFFLLLCICWIPFGGHFVKNGMSSLEQLMLDDPTYPITNTMYGAINSAVSIPNMILPFVGGHMLDRKGYRCILLFLVMMVFGQTLFAWSMQSYQWSLALIGRVIFGMGEGSVVVGARAIVAYWFDTSELTFAMGTMVAVTNLAKMLAKATMAPVAIHYGSYISGFWYGDAVCFASFLFAVIVVRITRILKRLKKKLKFQVRTGAPFDPTLRWLKMYMVVQHKQLANERLCHSSFRDFASSFPTMFWIVVFLHVAFINVFHLFQNISSSYLYQVYGYSIVNSGYLSSLSHSLVMFSPFLGLLLDMVGGRLVWVTLSTICGILAFSWLIFTPFTPIVALLLISLCLSTTPAVLMASIPLTIPKERFGVAFGIVEVLDAIGATFGNLLVGYLRDITGSYDWDMFFFLGLSIISFLLSLSLIFFDDRHGRVLASPTYKSRARSICDDSEPCVAIMSMSSANAAALRRGLGPQSLDTTQSDIFFQQLAMFACLGRQEEERVSSVKARQEAEFLSLLHAYFCGNTPNDFTQYMETPRRREPLRPRAPSTQPPIKQVQPSPQVAQPAPPTNNNLSPLTLPRLLPVVTPSLHLPTPSPPTNQKANYHLDNPATTYSDARSRQAAYSISSTTPTTPEDYDDHYNNPSPTSSVGEDHNNQLEQPHHEAENRFDVVFQQQSMGMKLGYDPVKKCAFVKESFEGTESKKYSQITSGVSILSVNGLSLCGISLSKIMSRLREAQRPAVIRFERPTP